MIKGGYILQPRSWDSSTVANLPPVVREVWFYLLRHVSHKDDEICKRGEGYFSLEKIQKDLSWKVGYRPMKYSKPQLTKSLRRLREGNMIATPKATRGVFVSIINYSFYQTPANYESNDEETAKEPRKQREGNALKNGKEYKNDKKEEREEEFTLNITDYEPPKQSDHPLPLPTKPKKVSKNVSRPDFTTGATYQNPGFSALFCASQWQIWCTEKNPPYKTQTIAEEALAYLYELSKGDEKLALAALRDARISGWQSFKWYFKHNNNCDHGTLNTGNGQSSHGAANLEWLESHS